MARGQYELPPGLPKPAFGPSRPPSWPSRSSSNSPTASNHPSPASFRAPSEPISPRTDVIIISLTESERHDRTIQSVKTKLDSVANVEYVGKINEVADAFARRPTAIVISQNSLQEASLETEADRYVRNGGILIKDPSQALLALKDIRNAKNESTANGYDNGSW